MYLYGMSVNTINIGLMGPLVHKCTGFKQTFKMFIPHYIMVICAVLVSYVSSQKGEFLIVGYTRLLYMCLMALL